MNVRTVSHAVTNFAIDSTTCVVTERATYLLTNSVTHGAAHSATAGDTDDALEQIINQWKLGQGVAD